MNKSEKLDVPEITTRPKISEQDFNNNVYVKVTPAGEQVRNEYFKKLGIEAPPLEKDKEGWTKMQLWEVMGTFGREMRMGNVNLPLEMTFKIENTV
jgi:hypothetical protein